MNLTSQLQPVRTSADIMYAETTDQIADHTWAMLFM